MTLFIVLLLAASFGWLFWEGWQRYRRAPARAAGTGSFVAAVVHRQLQQELDYLRVQLAAQQQLLGTLQEEMAQLTARLNDRAATQPQRAERNAPAAELPHPSDPSSAHPATSTPADLAPSAPVAATNVSPEYAEPLALARRGLDPEALVSRCGVTLAEAQLICALAQSMGQRSVETEKAL